MKYTTTLLLSLFAACGLSAQNAIEPKWTASADQMPGHLKAFEENKGQFVNLANDWNIAYGANCGSTRIMFTNKGILYYIPERVKMTDEENEQAQKAESVAQLEQEHETRYKTIYHVVTVEWENANPSLTIEPVSKTSFYFGSYNAKHKASVENISGYKEIIYHNVYPGVDIDFTFHPSEGIKYALKLKPGCNASAFKMHISGDEGVTLDAQGNLHIKTVKGDIIDHAPVTMQDNSQLGSSFQMTGNNEVAFKLNNYDNKLSAVIDPWTTVPPGSGNVVIDIGADASNNVYVLLWDTLSGGIAEQKYNTAGVMLWNYNFSQYDSVNIASDLAVDPSGNSYVPQPYYYKNDSGYSYALVCLNTAGSLAYFYSKYYDQDGAVFETWNMEYSTMYNKLVEAGAPTIAQEQVGIVNPANGYFKGSLYQNAAISEIYAGAVAPNGNYYAITSNPCFCNSGAGAFDQQLEAFNISGNTPSLLWNVTIPKYNFADFEFKNPAGTGVDRGISTNSIGAGSNAVYTSNGKWLYRYDITTGALLDSVTIAGGSDTVDVNAGIAVDSCDAYVFVGSKGAVNVYNGTTLAFHTSLSTPGIVYDMVLNKGMLAVCGNSATGGYVETYSIPGCITGVNEVSSTRPDFSVYPNPSNGSFNLTIKNLEPGMDYNVQVYNTLGQLVLNKALGANQDKITLDLSTYPNGMYCVRLSDGQNIVTQKVIKQ